jgi:hypothetical protein
MLIPLDEPTDTVAELVRKRGGSHVADTAADSGDWRDPTGGVGLAEVLAGRRSVRTFAAQRPAVVTLTEVVRLAAHSQRRQWSAACCGSAGLRVLLAAYRVAGLDAGLYSWEGDRAGWLSLGVPAWLGELPGRYTDAPALMLVCGSYRRAGAAGYGGLVVRAGALGYAVWLAARTHRLEASVYGRPSAEPATALASVDNGLRHLFTVAVGYGDPAGQAR